MTINWKQETHAAWTTTLASNDYDTIGVLKFDNGRFITAKHAQALYKAYWHKVDRTIYGRAADKGYGVKRWCFAELGSDGNNLHLHFVAASPFHTNTFCAALNALWVNFNTRTADYRHNWITPIQHKTKAAAYTAKGTKKFTHDKIGQATSFQPHPNLQTQYFDTAAQARRITNRLTKQHFEQAYFELERQIEATTQRLNRRK